MFNTGCKSQQSLNGRSILADFSMWTVIGSCPCPLKTVEGDSDSVYQSIRKYLQCLDLYIKNAQNMPISYIFINQI